MPNGGPPMRTVSVTVISLGKQGRKMLEPTASCLENVGVHFLGSNSSGAVDSEEYRAPGCLVSIDHRNQSEQSAKTPSGTVELTLDSPQKERENGKQIEYIHEEAAIATPEDRRQYRGVGRYLLEANYGKISKRLKEEIENLAPDESSARTIHQVWIVHSLSDGFASGALPLLASLIRNLESDVATETGSKILLGGVGILPSLSDQLGHIDSPVPPLINAYTTLRELEYLHDYEYSETERYPLELTVQAADAQDTIQIEMRPFHLYGFARVEFATEAVATPPQSVTQTVSNAIGAFAATRPQPYYGGSDPRGLGRAPKYGAAIFVNTGPPPERTDSFNWFSLDSRTIRLPTEKIEQYRETKADIEDLNEDITKIRAELQSREQDREKLENILVESDPLNELPSEIGTVIEETVSELTTTDGKEWIQSKKEELDEQINDEYSEVAAKYVFYRELNRSYREKARELDFHQKITGVTAVLGKDDIPSRSDSPLQRWRGDVRPALEEELTRLRKLRESTFPIRIFRIRELEERIGAYEERKQLLDLVAREYDRLQTLSDWCQTNYEQYHERLGDSVDEYDSTIDELLRELDQHEMKRDALSKELEQVRDQVQKNRRHGNIVWLPVSVDSFDEYEKTSTLSDHCISEIVDSELVHQTTDEILKELDFRRPLQRASSPGQSSVLFSGVFGLTDEANRSILTESETALNSLRKSSEMIQWVDGNFPHSIRFVRVEEPVALNQIHQFRRLHELFTDPDHNVSELFMGNDQWTDEEIERRFGYPEWFGF